MKRVSKDVLSPLGVSAISCRAQLGQGLRGRHEKPWLVLTVSAEAQSRRGQGDKTNYSRRLRLVPSPLNSSIMVISSLYEVLRIQKWGWRWLQGLDPPTQSPDNPSGEHGHVCEQAKNVLASFPQLGSRANKFVFYHISFHKDALTSYDPICILF